MNAPHGVPMKASTDGRSKKFAIAIAQLYQGHQYRNVLGIKDCPAFTKTIKNIPSHQYGLIGIQEELRAKATNTSVDTVVNSVRSRS